MPITEAPSAATGGRQSAYPSQEPDTFDSVLNESEYQDQLDLAIKSSQQLPSVPGWKDILKSIQQIAHEK
jgi:hypothetical protein